jgi:hypothetical protein
MKDINLQNYSGTSIPEDLLEELKVSTDLNIRGSGIETLKIDENDALERINIKQTRELKTVSLHCKNLKTLSLTGTAVEVLELHSDEMLELNLRGAKKLKTLILKTPNIEHLEIEKRNLHLLLQDIKLPKLQSINHIYRNVSIQEFVEKFDEFEKEDSEKRKHSGGCGCSSCQETGEKEIFPHLDYVLKV